MVWGREMWMSAEQWMGANDGCAQEQGLGCKEWGKGTGHRGTLRGRERAGRDGWPQTAQRGTVAAILQQSKRGRVAEGMRGKVVQNMGPWEHTQSAALCSKPFSSFPCNQGSTGTFIKIEAGTEGPSPF